jgi:hypothetical protein
MGKIDHHLEGRDTESMLVKKIFVVYYAGLTPGAISYLHIHIKAVIFSERLVTLYKANYMAIQHCSPQRVFSLAFANIFVERLEPLRVR